MVIEDMNVLKHCFMIFQTHFFSKCQRK